MKKRKIKISEILANEIIGLANMRIVSLNVESEHLLVTVSEITNWPAESVLKLPGFSWFGNCTVPPEYVHK